MNKMINPNELLASVSLIPESAPFNEEQRSWLNGFFAGMTGIEEIARSQSGSTATTESGSIEADGVSQTEKKEDFPWHDDSLGIDERMELAQGKPHARKLMAAMAQLDCGSCGYLCQTYSEAIASGEESNLTLCTPGGKETAKMVKKLVKLEKESGNGLDSPNASATATQSTDSTESVGYSRKNPFTAKLIQSRKLTGEGSAKDVRHVEIDLTGSDLTYDVGDSLGLYPTNCTDLVDEILEHCDCDSPQTRTTVSEVLLTRDLAATTDELCDLYAAGLTDDVDRQRLNALVKDDDQLDELDVLDFLQIFSNFRPPAMELAQSLPELSPRLYSIASSLKAHPDQVHLTVGKVTYLKEERLRKGVASTLLAERVQEGSSLRVFVQKSHGFTVPADDNASMIMVGPGTGIAPFMAFLQERSSRKSPGKNWLFFGDQKSSTDYLYHDQLGDYQRQGILHRVDTAFSRDQDQKIYVQDRMRENASELFQWLESGASFFVCGDASRMAKDVDKALHEIVKEQGNLSTEKATAYIKALKASGRYSRDVY
jgi:sulfite reductase (NADPH) flavoprotein alpha-component